jgi:hypothetical protein
VYTPPINFTAIDFVQTPDCGYNLTYTIQIKEGNNSYTPLPSWLTVKDFLSFSVFSNDTTILGMYHLSIIGSVPQTYMNPVYSEELIINVKINLGC